MIYESMLTLAGFRLKLHFDAALLLEPTYVYVELSKIPNIAALENDIKKRFELTQDIFITLHNYKLMQSENASVLAGVSHARVCTSSKASSLSSLEHKMNVDALRNINLEECNDCVEEFHARKEREELVLNSNLSNLSTQICTALQELSQKQIRKTRKSKEFNQSLKCETPVPIKKLRKKANENEITETVQCTNAELTESVLEDTNGRMLEKRKRKRKRKHLKRNKEEMLVDDCHEAEGAEENIPVIPRKHIYFDEEGKQKNYQEERNSDRNQALDLSIGVDTTQNVCDIIGNKPAKVQKLSTSCSKSQDSEVSNSVQNLFNEIQKITITSPISKPKINQEKSQVSNVKNFFFNYSNLETTINKKNEFSFPNFPFQRKEKDMNSDQTIEKELSTLLMCKQLNTFCHYDVEFAGNKKSEVNTEVSSMNKTMNLGENISKNFEEVGPTKNSKTIRQKMNIGSLEASNKFQDCESVSEMCASFRKESGNTAREIKIESEKQDCIDVTSNDCEVLIQFKTIEDKIRFRTSDIDWQTLTPEIAIKALPVLNVPKDNQSIVFQILYLNQETSPTLSDLMYGLIIRYNADTESIGLFIPSAFIQKLLKDCSEMTLPEGLTQTADNTYEVHRSVLRNALVLS